MKKIMILFLFGGIAGCYDGRAPLKTGLEGQIMPSIDLFLADSSTYFNTSNIAAGKASVLLFVDPHCPYSQLQMEEIIKDINILNNTTFYVFTTTRFEEMKSFYRKYQLDKYPNITMGIDYTSFFGSYFKVPGVPSMAIYGKEKKLKEVFSGTVQAKQIKRVIEK